MPAEGTTDAHSHSEYHRALVWLTVTALGYSAMHHLGTGLAHLGEIGATRWADWIDLLTPYTVLVPAAATLAAARAPHTAWTVYLVGAITYAEGHGIHLSANSIGNAEPSTLAHLWDEIAGHYIWYAGVYLVFTSLALTLARQPLVTGHLAPTLAVAVGVTVATNSLEGGTTWLTLAVCLALALWGWATRQTLGRLLLYVHVPALMVMLAYGLYHRGFPQPSS